MEWILLVQTRNVGFVTNISTAEYLSAWKELGNLEIAEVLRDYVASNPQREQIYSYHPGWGYRNEPRFQCGICKKYCKASDRLLECEECEKCFHASCSNLGDNELLRIESSDGAWYCTNCKADCKADP